MEPQNEEPFYKGRSLPFIEQGEGCVTMWDKSLITWDPLSQLNSYYSHVLTRVSRDVVKRDNTISSKLIFERM